jgi:hypothetical protein
LSLRAPDAACAVILVLLSGCASTASPKKHFLEDSYARYYDGGAGKVLRVEKDGTVLDVGCLPIERSKDTPRQRLPTKLCQVPDLGKAQKVGGEWDVSPYAAEPETGGGDCRPLMDPLINALDTSRWGAGRDDLDLRSDRYHSCWNRLWEVPTAIVAYPTATVVLVGVVTSPVWVPLLLLVIF